MRRTRHGDIDLAAVVPTATPDADHRMTNPSSEDIMTEIVDFASFLQAASEQPTPQRLLFVFLKTGLPDDHDEEQARRFRAGQGGALLPVMYVDKTPDEIASFEALADEARLMGEEWQIVLVAAIAGRPGKPPTSEAADEALKSMVKTVHAGGDLSAFLAFDRGGEPVRFGG
jgi:hypothetical protein